MNLLVRATKGNILELKSELYKAMMIQTFAVAGIVVAVIKFMN